jgi:hypothetical protein
MVMYHDDMRNHMQYDHESNSAFKSHDTYSSVETRASTKSPNSGADAEEFQLMDELVDAEALACSMPQQMTRLPGDNVYDGGYNMAEAGPGMMSPTNMVMEMPSNMPMQMMPSNAPVMYTSMGASMGMQLASQAPQAQVPMQWPAGAMQPGAMQGQQQQYVQVPMMMPVRMVPVQMPMQMGAQVPQGYYLVSDPAEQQAPQPQPVPAGPADPDSAPKNFLESLMPTGWRKRQRPSKRPAARMQKVPSGRKIFVGGLSPNSTAESLINHFSEFGKISDASVIHEAVTRRSRGFGYVEFVDKIPDGLLEMEHYIDQRRCGVRGYSYDPEEPAPGAKND